MILRLWINWIPAEGQIWGYHLEVDRPYERVPAVGETIDLPTTQFGTSHPSIEGINWDEELPNLRLGEWEESEGDNLDKVKAAGFHLSDAQRPGCRQCARVARLRNSIETDVEPS